jgi:hypothetical protein
MPGAIKEIIQSARIKYRREPDLVNAGDFNRHDLLWEVVRSKPQGEAELLILFAQVPNLINLLPRATKTFCGPKGGSTSGLICSTERLAEKYTRCAIHNAAHGSDHEEIETFVPMQTPAVQKTHRRLF